MTMLENAAKVKNQTKEAIELILGELNKGQRKKIAENEKIKPMLERFGVEIEL